MLQIFYTEIRTKDGFEYEPASLKLISSPYCSLSRVCLGYSCFVSCKMSQNVAFRIYLHEENSKFHVNRHYISLDENLHSCKDQWSCWKKNLKGLKDKVCGSKQKTSFRIPSSEPFIMFTRNSGSTSLCFLYQAFVNNIDNMMKGVINNTPLETSKKKLTNHTPRKTVVKKLRAASVKRQSIIQMTGHASEKSPDQPIWSFRPTTSTSEQVNTSGHAFTVNNFHNCQITFNVV